MKYFITGGTGQLGYDLEKLLVKTGDIVLSTDVDTLDITDKEQVLLQIKNFNPDVIIHCAAWTAVDLAEDEKEKCYDVNVIGTQNIALAAKACDAKLIYISTDYVFDGEKTGVYSESDTVNPLGVYGSTKLLGEKEVLGYDKHFIVRISWVFGINGNNFVKTMLKLSKTHKNLTVVADQIGSPTYTKDLAKLLVEMGKSEKYGTYHATNEGFCSWAEFAREIFKQINVDVVVEDILATDFKTKAKRPYNSKMSKDKLEVNGFDRLPDWQDALKRYLIELDAKGEL